MQDIIKSFAGQNHIDIMRIVNIRSLTLEEHRGYSYAILLIKALPKEYIVKLNREAETDYTVFANYENATDKLQINLLLLFKKKGIKRFRNQNMA